MAEGAVDGGSRGALGATRAVGRRRSEREETRVFFSLLELYKSRRR